MNGNKLLTGFLVLGMGLSLVACSNDKPESKKEEAKVAEKKKEEKRMDTQDRTAKLSVPEDLSPYFTSSREGVGKMESMLKDNGSIVYKCLNEENKYELNAEIKLLSSSSAEKSADLQNSMYGENDEDKKYKPCTFEGFDAYSHTINLGTVENTRLHYYVDYPVKDINKVVSIEINQKNDKEKDTSDLEPFAKAIIKNMKLEKVKEEKKEEVKKEVKEEKVDENSKEIVGESSRAKLILPRDLTSFYTPSMEYDTIKGNQDKGNVGYTLSREDPKRTVSVSICTDSSSTLEEAIVFHNEHLSDDEEPFTEYTLGEYSGYRATRYTNYWNSANDTTYMYKLSYLVGDKNVILSCRVTLRDNSDDTTGLEDILLAALQQLKVEIK